MSLNPPIAPSSKATLTSFGRISGSAASSIVLPGMLINFEMVSATIGGAPFLIDCHALSTTFFTSGGRIELRCRSGS